MNNPIVFFDSGIGGLPYLLDLRNRVPNENYIYIADSKNFPYGEKDTEDLKRLIIEVINQIIIKIKPKVIVIACNTASVTALDHIRSLTEIPIVGVVPAIKTASRITKNNRIGILATKRTVEGIYLKELIKSFSSENDVFLVGASNIVDFVERELYHYSNSEKLDFINNEVSILKKYDVDTVVLGCTHFLHVADEIKKSLGDNVTIVDSREGVSKQILRVITLNSHSEEKGSTSFYLTQTGSKDNNYYKLCDDNNIKFRGEFTY